MIVSSPPVPFEKLLDEKPNDWDLRLAYSDWLEEQGDEDFAYCQKWMVNGRKHPSAYFVKKPYGHATWHCRGTEFNEHFRIPDELIVHFDNDGDIEGERLITSDLEGCPLARQYENRELAEQALSRALKRLKENEREKENG